MTTTIFNNRRSTSTSNSNVFVNFIGSLFQKTEAFNFRKCFYLDKRSLTLFRICFALYLLADLLSRSQYLLKHYGAWGVLPPSLVIVQDRYSFHQMCGNGFFLFILFGFHALVYLSLLVGYKTRISTVLSFIMLCSMQNRNHFLLDGSDDYTRVMLFWSIFLPLGSYFSLDSIIKLQKLKKFKQPQEKESKSNNQQQHYYHSIGSIGFIFQFCIIYIFTAILKHGDSWHKDYTSVYYAINLIEFKWGLSDFILSFPSLTIFLTKFTLLFEFVGPILIISPIFNSILRIVSIIGFIGMHIGFGICLNLYLFIFIPMVVCIAFIPSAMWDQLIIPYFEKKRENNIITIYYNSQSPLLGKWLLYYNYFFLLTNRAEQIVKYSKYDDDDETEMGWDEKPQKPIMTSQITSTPHMGITINGEHLYLEYDSVLVLLSKSYLLFPISYLVNNSFSKFWYKFLMKNYFNTNTNIIGGSNTIIKDLLEKQEELRSLDNNNNVDIKDELNSTSSSTSSSSSFTSNFFIKIICWLLMANILYYNMVIYKSSIDRSPNRYPIPFEEYTRILKIDQFWGMFAPEPPKSSKWMIIEGKFENYPNQLIDPHTNLPTNYEEIPSIYFNIGQRDRNFLLGVASNDNLRLPYGRYICRKWNIFEKDEQRGRLISFKILTVIKSTPLPSWIKNDYIIKEENEKQQKQIEQKDSTHPTLVPVEKEDQEEQQQIIIDDTNQPKIALLDENNNFKNQDPKDIDEIDYYLREVIHTHEC